MTEQLTIAFARRGYSQSGGAEAYLKRLARGVIDAGHKVMLFATNGWPPSEWPSEEIVRVRSESPVGFANELERVRAQTRYDVLMSFERVWSCDIYRAGDGIHRAWLERRSKFATPLQRFVQAFNRKHRAILRLEKSLFADGGAKRVIANSDLVREEIADLYDYPPDKIQVVRNGVPLDQFRFNPEIRAKARASLKVKPHSVAVLFAGSGWERKGLRFAISAVEACRDRRVHLLVAGRGKRHRYKSERAQYFGEVINLPVFYAAADIFILPTIYDPFSNACLEALASGLPVITTRANGFSEIIEDGVHGSIVDLPNNIEALRTALELWSDDARRSRAMVTIMERAAQFDISTNVAQTLEVLIQSAARAAST